MNFATVDPGRETGLAVWSDELTESTMWTLLHVGTLRYTGARDYLDRLDATIRNYGLQFSVIEKYVNFGRRFVNAERMIVQQTLLVEAFRDVVLIGKRSWDPANSSPMYQHLILRDFNILTPVNEHERDAVHMGINIFRRLPTGHAEKAGILRAAAMSDHKIKLM